MRGAVWKVQRNRIVTLAERYSRMGSYIPKTGVFSVGIVKKAYLKFNIVSGDE